MHVTVHIVTLKLHDIELNKDFTQKIMRSTKYWS